MNRRHAGLALLLGQLSSCAAPRAAEAQRAGKVYRIGVLGLQTAAESAEDMGVFRQALRELGWVNERAIKFEERYVDGHYERAPRLAAELVGLKVDLIFADGGTPVVEAAMKATREIPIVFSSVGDPVTQKLVKSLAHPGGNVTGFSIMSGETFTRKMALLKEAVPGIKRVAYLLNSANSAGAYFLPVGRTASQSLGIQLEPFDIRDFEDLDKAFEKMSRAGVQAIMVMNDTALNSKLKQIGMLALTHRLPMTAGEDENGVLLTYNQDAPALYRQAAAQVDKILRGANPGDVPVEQPTKFRLVINLRTATALGLTIPQSLLLQADELIR
jgi:putative tryptophan/tyrosine transport system substrate-binding protein